MKQWQVKAIEKIDAAAKQAKKDVLNYPGDWNGVFVTSTIQISNSTCKDGWCQTWKTWINNYA